MARVEPPGMGLRRLYDLPVLSVACTLSAVWLTCVSDSGA